MATIRLTVGSEENRYCVAFLEMEAAAAGRPRLNFRVEWGGGGGGGDGGLYGFMFFVVLALLSPRVFLRGRSEFPASVALPVDGHEELFPQMCRARFGMMPACRRVASFAPRCCRESQH